MQRIRLACLSMALACVCCKSGSKKHTAADPGAPAKKDEVVIPAEEIKKKPDVPVEPVPVKTQTDPAKPAEVLNGPSAAFPYTIEMPKARIPNPAAAADLDNSCSFFSKYVQTGENLAIHLNSFGAAVAPGTATTGATNRSASTQVVCKLWGRIKDVPAGYFVSGDWSSTSSLKYKASMRSYKPPVAGSTAPLTGDQVPFGAGAFVTAHTQDGTNTLLYGNNMVFTKVISFAADTVSPDVQAMSYADLGITPSEPDPTNECPKVKHDIIFAIPNGLLLTMRVYSNGLANVPNDGFTHSFYVTELPSIKFTIKKCN